MITEEKDKLDEKLSKAIFITGAPMDMVSHPLWIDFFHEIRYRQKIIGSRIRKNGF